MITTEKFCKKCNTTKPAYEFHKRSKVKDGLQSKCKSCMNDYYKTNAEKLIAATRKWEANNKQRKNATQKNWREKNQQSRSESVKNYYENNKEKCAIASKKWKINNSGKLLGYAAKRRSIKLMAMPAWADKIAIEEIYNKAAQMRKNGMDVHVDHVIPLQSKKVCGLHVAQNLRIVSAMENLQKANKF